MGKLIMLNTNSTLSNSARLLDIINQPVEIVIEYLKDKPDFIGEAIAKQAYQHISQESCIKNNH